MMLSSSLKIKYLAVLIAAALLYIITCAPGVLWQDSGMYQYRSWHNDIEGGLGLALAHPLFHILGILVKVIPAGDFAYKVNLISAICGAITIANLFLLVYLFTGKNFPALVAAITLGISWTFWQFSAIAEVYSLYTALFTLELLLMFEFCKTNNKKYLYLLGFFNGLAIANHMFAVIATGCYFVFLIFLLIKKQIYFKQTSAVILLIIIGAFPYEYLIIKNILQTGDVQCTILSALFGNGWGKTVLNTSITPRILKENVIFILYNFPTPNFIFLFFGFNSLRTLSLPKNFKVIFSVLLILFFLFAFRYNVPDRYSFFIPFYCLASIIVGLGINQFLKKYENRTVKLFILLLSFLPIAIYMLAPEIVEKNNFAIGTKREIPYRNDIRWFLQPWQICYNGPQRFATEALENIEQNAAIIADGTTVYPLWYVQTVKRMRLDVKIFAKHGSYQSPEIFPDLKTAEKLTAKQLLYVVSPVAGYCPDFLLENFNFVNKGVLWKVVIKKGTIHE